MIEINTSFDNYLTDPNSYKFVSDTIRSIKDYDEKIPICVLSYKYDKKRSKFIVQLINEIEQYGQLNRPVIIFVYEEEKELYSFLLKYDGIELVYIKKDNENSTLSGKRNFIINYANEHGFRNIFMIEDDCDKFFIPIQKFKESKFAKNSKYYLTIKLTFDLWEHIALDNNFVMTSPLIEFAVVIQQHSKMFTTNTTCIQMFQFNIEYLINNKLKFDHNSGWDDFDMNIQVFESGQDIHTLYPLGYSTISVKSGNSVIDNNIFERFKTNSYIFLNKWGANKVKIVDKRGLINARIDWRKLKKNRNQTVLELDQLF